MTMNSRRFFLQSLNLLNLLMTAIAIAVFHYFLNPLLTTPIAVKVPAPSDASSGMPARTDEATKPSTADYALIGEQNLFHPNRLIPEGKKMPTPATLPRPELALHGTMIAGELKVAYLEDKKAAPKTPGRNAPSIVVREGDHVSGYILKQITENMIVLANGEEQMSLYLDELKDRKGEITGPTKAPAPAAVAPPQAVPRPATPPPPQRPSMVQPAPPTPSSPPRGSFPQPVSPTAPPGFSGPPDLPYAPQRPWTPPPSSPPGMGQP